MKSINILHLVPAENSEFLQKIISANAEQLDVDRFQNTLATVSFRFSPPSRSELNIPTFPLGWAWGKGPWNFLQLIRKENIHILHNHMEPAASWSFPFSTLNKPVISVRNFYGGTPYPTFTPLPKRFPWKNYQRIAIPEWSDLNRLKIALPLPTHRIFVNPLSIPEELFEPLIDVAKESARLTLVLENFSHPLKILPPVISTAYRKIKKYFPQTLLRWQSIPQTKGPLQKETEYRLHLILTQSAPSEVIFFRFLEFCAQGIPFLLIGPNLHLPSFLGPLPKIQIPLLPEAILEAVQNIFDSPSFFQKENQIIRNLLQKNWGFSKHAKLWSEQYEELIESSSEKKWAVLKRPSLLGSDQPPPLSDEEFFNLLNCPACHQKMEPQITESQNKKAWQGNFNCSCGKKYPLIRGIPRLFTGAWETFVEKNPVLPQNSGLHFSYWQKHYEKNPHHFKNFYQKKLAPIIRDLPPHCFIMELECGCGGALREMARSGARGIGFESSFRIDEAQKYLHDVPQFRLVQALPSRVPIKPGVCQVGYHLQANPLDSTPLLNWQKWKDLLLPQSPLHLYFLTAPFSSGWKKTTLENLKPVLSLLPNPFISGFAGFLAFLEGQVFKRKITQQETFFILKSNWFRYLTCPDSHFPNSEILQKWSQEANFRQVEIKAMEPHHLHLFLQT